MEADPIIPAVFGVGVKESFPELLTMAEIAAALGCNPKTVNGIVKSGALTRVEIGGRKRFVAVDIRTLKAGGARDVGRHVQLQATIAATPSSRTRSAPHDRKASSVTDYDESIRAEPSPWLKQREVGLFFGCTTRTVRNWVRRGWLIQHRVGKSVYYHRADVERLASIDGPQSN